MKFELQEAIDDLYEAFADASRPTRAQDLDICPCCVHDDDVHLLLTTELRGLAAPELGQYMSTATGPETKGDFLYFFPRIAEVLFVEGFAYEWAVTFARLGNLEAQSWTQRQRSGLIRFMSSFLGEVNRLANEVAGDYGWVLEQILYCHAISGMPMRPLLDELLSYPPLLASFYETNAGIEATGVLSYNFGTPMPDDARAEVREWMESEHFLLLGTEPEN